MPRLFATRATCATFQTLAAQELRAASLPSKLLPRLAMGAGPATDKVSLRWGQVPHRRHFRRDRQQRICHRKRAHSAPCPRPAHVGRRGAAFGWLAPPPWVGRGRVEGLAERSGRWAPSASYKTWSAGRRSSCSHGAAGAPRGPDAATVASHATAARTVASRVGERRTAYATAPTKVLFQGRKCVRPAHRSVKCFRLLSWTKPVVGARLTMDQSGSRREISASRDESAPGQKATRSKETSSSSTTKT
jgi:hypothetical protein